MVLEGMGDVVWLLEKRAPVSSLFFTSVTLLADACSLDSEFDRTSAFLGGCCARLAPEPKKKRSPRRSVAASASPSWFLKA